MTLAATRRYAFGASALLGLAATLAALALISALIGDPKDVVTALNAADLSAFLRLVFDRLAAVARAALGALAG
jgi:hypothetical protein